MSAKETLDTMLGYLGFVTEIQETETSHGVHLQVLTREGNKLIGRNGETLEDIQYLLNRMLQAKDRNAPKVQVDVEHYRSMRQDALIHKVKQLAETVRATGRPFTLEPMNAYDRHLVHDAFKDDPEVMSVSPADDARLKRITLKKRE